MRFPNTPGINEDRGLLGRHQVGWGEGKQSWTQIGERWYLPREKNSRCLHPRAVQCMLVLKERDYQARSKIKDPSPLCSSSGVAHSPRHNAGCTHYNLRGRLTPRLPCSRASIMPSGDQYGDLSSASVASHTRHILLIFGCNPHTGSHSAA